MGIDARLEIGRLGDCGRPAVRQSPISQSLNLLLIVLLAADLLLAALALPHTHPTAPQAVYDVRTAPAYLLSDPARTTLSAAGAGAF